MTRGLLFIVTCLSLAFPACHRPEGCWAVPVLGPSAGPLVDALTTLEGPLPAGLAGWERTAARVSRDRVDLELARGDQRAHLGLVHPSAAAAPGGVKGLEAPRSRFFALDAPAEDATTQAVGAALLGLVRDREGADPWTWLPRPTSRAVGREAASTAATDDEPSTPRGAPWGLLAAGLAALALGLGAARVFAKRAVGDATGARWTPPRALAVALASGALGAVFLLPHLLRWQGLGPDSYDLGVFAHAFWNATQGCGFFNSPEGLDHQAWHMSPALWALVPVYAAVGSPLVLLLANGVALALAAWPLWRLARVGLAPAAALAAAALVLAHPALSSLNHDFHPVALAVPLLLLGVVGAVRGRAGVTLGALALALTSEETVALPVVGLGLYLLAGRGSRRLGLLVTALGAAALVVAFLWWLPAFGGDALPAVRRYASLGTSWGELLAAPFVRPALFWGRLFSEGSLAYVVKLLAPLACLPLLAPRAWLVLLPPLLQVLLADGDALRSLNGHYEALLLPGLALATLQGLARLATWAGGTDRPPDPRTEPDSAARYGLLALVPALAALLLVPIAHGSLGRGHFSELRAPNSADLARVLAAVPPGVGIAAPARLQARLADRPVASIVQRPADLASSEALSPLDAVLWPTALWAHTDPDARPPRGFAPALVTPSCTLYLRTEESP